MGFIFASILILLPIIAAIITIIIAIFTFIGMCLLVIGVTGVAMNKIYIKQTQSKKGKFKSIYNVSSIVAGIMLMLLPWGYGLYLIISASLS